ncbi:MAG: hypothetical protein RMN25_03335 [Anaerolineae bacterium]|nr:hypothetical protein [Thermoflexales bacterium]MDW8406792.1 hypothetical protein [Anaerolineae bacterium]
MNTDLLEHPDADAGQPLPEWVRHWRERLEASRSSLSAHYGLRGLWMIGATRDAPVPDRAHLLVDLGGRLNYEQFVRLGDELSELLGIRAEIVLRGRLDPEIEVMVWPGLIRLV